MANCVFRFGRVTVTKVEEILLNHFKPSHLIPTGTQR